MNLFEGHYYEFRDDARNFSSAQRIATSSKFRNVTGHLVTVTSANESAFRDAMMAFGWLALSDRVVEGQFVFTDGPETGLLANFTAWATLRPNGTAA